MRHLILLTTFLAVTLRANAQSVGDSGLVPQIIVDPIMGMVDTFFVPPETDRAVFAGYLTVVTTKSRGAYHGQIKYRDTSGNIDIMTSNMGLQHIPASEVVSVSNEQYSLYQKKTDAQEYAGITRNTASIPTHRWYGHRAEDSSAADKSPVIDSIFIITTRLGATYRGRVVIDSFWGTRIETPDMGIQPLATNDRIISVKTIPYTRAQHTRDSAFSHLLRLDATTPTPFQTSLSKLAIQCDGVVTGVPDTTIIDTLQRVTMKDGTFMLGHREDAGPNKIRIRTLFAGSQTFDASEITSVSNVPYSQYQRAQDSLVSLAIAKDPVATRGYLDPAVLRSIPAIGPEELDTSKRPHASQTDSNLLHIGPYGMNDSTVMHINLKQGRAHTGHIIARDSNWITFIDYSGLRQQVDAHMVTGIMRQKDYYDSVSKSRQTMTPVNRLSYPYRENLEWYLAPTALAGETRPTNGSSPGVSWSAGAIFGVRIPGLLFHYLGEFVSVGTEYKYFFHSDHELAVVNKWALNYLSVMPGLSYRGLVSIGVAFGFPISAEYKEYYTYAGSSQFGYSRPFRAASVNTLIEPRIVLGLPLAYHNDERILMLLVQAGYPLSPIFKDNSLEPGPLGSTAAAALYPARLPEVTVGLSYVFSLSPMRGFTL